MDGKTYFHLKRDMSAVVKRLYAAYIISCSFLQLGYAIPAGLCLLLCCRPQITGKKMKFFMNHNETRCGHLVYASKHNTLSWKYNNTCSFLFWYFLIYDIYIYIYIYAHE